MNITEDIKYIGVDDTELDLFEGQYIVPDGMCYNSYLILDEKTAVLDTTDTRFNDEWMANLSAALDGRTPDFLVVHHMEPDHASSICAFAEKYPEAKIAASAKAFTMMKNFFGTDFADRQIVIKEGSTLELGKHTLTFFAAPMVHWPEVMVSYDDADKVLFSADAFGKFGTLNAEDDEGWSCEARRYYFGIVGKYGVQVQNLLKKLINYDVQKICPLHGPILTENLGYYFNLYQIWSSYGVETDGVAVFYASAHGHTKAAAELLAEKLKEKGCPKVSLVDLAREDMAEAVEDAFRFGKIVLASITYNTEIFPCMKDFINHLVERGYQNRRIGIIENGSWAPTAAKVMTGMFEKCKNITFAETTVKLVSALSDESRAQIEALAEEMAK